MSKNLEGITFSLVILSANVTQDLDNVDIDNEDFRGLPLELQHEVLAEMLERGRKWRYDEQALAALPTEAEEFSETQFERLMRRGRLHQRLDSVRAAMLEQQTAEVATRLMATAGKGHVQARRIVSQVGCFLSRDASTDP